MRAFTIRFDEPYVRLVPGPVEAEGRPGEGVARSRSSARTAAGFVTLRGDLASRAALVAGETIVRALAGLEPGVEVAVLSVRLDERRILATLGLASGPGETPGRPRVVRLEGMAWDMVMGDAGPLVAMLEAAEARAVARRGARPGPA